MNKNFVSSSGFSAAAPFVVVWSFFSTLVRSFGRFSNKPPSERVRSARRTLEAAAPGNNQFVVIGLRSQA
jgi:hypothetical protein